MTIMTKINGVATAFSFAALMSVGGATLASAEDVTLTMAVPRLATDAHHEEDVRRAIQAEAPAIK